MQQTGYTGWLGEPPEPAVDTEALPKQADLGQALQTLYNTIARQRRQLELQQSLLCRMSVELMMDGRWKPTDHTNEILGFSQTHYLVACYDFAPGAAPASEDEQTLLPLKRQISKALDSRIGGVCGCCYFESPDCLGGLLLNVPALTGALEATLLQCLDQALEDARSACGLPLILGLGRCCRDVKDLPGALWETKRLLRLQRVIPGVQPLLYAGRLRLYGDVGQTTPRDLEARLWACVEAADLPGANRALNLLAAARLEGGAEPEQLFRQLLEKLEEVQRRLGLERRGEAHLLAAREALLEAREPEECYLLLAAYFNGVEGLLKRLEPPAASEEAGQLPQRIAAFIAANYDDDSLNLSLLASTFQVPANTISKIFKKGMGMGVLTYMHSLRVREACWLLAQTGLSVGQIVTRTGYTNRRTFDRVFTRLTGMTAVQYRANARREAAG